MGSSNNTNDAKQTKLEEKAGPQEQTNAQQFSKVMPRAKKAKSLLETMMDARRQVAPRVARENDNDELPLVGDTSPVDRVPVDNTAPVVDEPATDTKVFKRSNSSPTLPEERAEKIKQQDDAFAWQDLAPLGVPLDEKARIDKKRAEDGETNNFGVPLDEKALLDKKRSENGEIDKC